MFYFRALLKGIPGVVDATFFFTSVIFNPRLCRNSHFGPNSTALAFQKPRHVFQDDTFSKRMFLQDELLRYSVVLWGMGGVGGV